MESCESVHHTGKHGESNTGGGSGGSRNRILVDSIYGSKWINVVDPGGSQWWILVAHGGSMWLILEEPSGGSWWIPVVEIDRSQRRILVDPHAESKWNHVVDPGLINEVDPGGST